MSLMLVLLYTYAVVPYPSFNTWTGSEVAEPPPALLRGSSTCLISEDPPPYTEVVQDGHISLMHGCSPNKDTQDSSCSPHRLSASFTANEYEFETSTASALLPFHTQGTSSPTSAHTSMPNTEDSQLSHPLATGHETLLRPPDYSEYSSDTLEVERRFLQEYDNSNLLIHRCGLHSVAPGSAIFPPRLIARSRSFDTTDSLLQGHAHNRRDSCPSSMFPPPLARLPSSSRAGTLPPPLTPFPPRPGTVPPLQNPLLPQHPHQPLPLATGHLRNRPVRPPPLRSQTLPPSTFRSSSSDYSSWSLQENPPALPPRLPPIQSQPLQSEVRTREGSGHKQHRKKQHRKKHKRKRGQTWHGERTPLVEQSVVVVE